VVQARVKDPFGEERVWRSYWKRKVIPDELVQRRINQFSAMLLDIRGGEVSNGGAIGRKRKFLVTPMGCPRSQVRAR
jgi:hypothetical protein